MKVAIALALAGLLAADSTAQAPRIRDSAGVRIIENGPRLSAPTAFQLGDKASFDVGGLQNDPRDELSPRNSYMGARRLSNGNVVVLDLVRVVFYDAAGKRIKAFGRQGRGPGEFVAAAGICETRGDTVHITQESLGITKLTTAGEFISTAAPPEGYLRREPCFEDGTYFAMTRTGRSRDGASRYRFLRAGPKGVINTITEETQPPNDALVQTSEQYVAHGNRLYLATTDRFEIRAFDPAGKLKEVIRTSDPLVPMTADDKARMPLTVAGGRRGVRLNLEAEKKRAVAASKIKYWPTLGRMLVDADNRIWVQDWMPREDPTWPQGWTAFDSSGRLLGRLMIPGAKSRELRHHPVHFGKNEVFLYRIDADGAAHYTAYPIIPITR